jgi:AcrR family transcriptional regulator
VPDDTAPEPETDVDSPRDLDVGDPDIIPDTTAPARPLTRRRILEAAVEFIDAEGLRQLTMRRLGTLLGVEAMALYRYVESRESLLDGIVDHVIDGLYGEQVTGMDDGAGWQDYLQRLAHGVRRIALLHPEVFPLIATRPSAAPWVRPPLRSLSWMESFLTTLLAHGFTDEGAVAAYRAFSSFLLGHLLLEVSARGVDTGPVEESAVGEPDAADLQGHPTLLRLREPLSEDHSAVEFEESLENLIERLGLLLPA